MSLLSGEIAAEGAAEKSQPTSRIAEPISICEHNLHNIPPLLSYTRQYQSIVAAFLSGNYNFYSMLLPGHLCVL